MTDAEITLEPEGLEHEQALNDRDWWRQAGDVLGLTLHGWTFRTIARFNDEDGATVNLTGTVAKRLIALSRSTLPREGQGEGWRLVPEEPTAAMIGAGILAYDGKCESSYAAMIDAAPLSLLAFGASDAACYLYPGEDQAELRAAYVAGAASALSPSPAVRDGVATHRHKKRGSQYIFLGIGRMQAKHWHQAPPTGLTVQHGRPVDMEEVAVYRDVEDSSLWVRPRDEFEDGRFEEIKE